MKTAGPRIPSSAAPQEAPLISNRFLYRLTAVIAALALLVAAISIVGRRAGERIALAGHTASEERFSVEIGQDRLRLAANTIRFGEARRSGALERTDLYLTWPEMAGYSDENSHRFNDTARPGQLIFLQLTQSTMSRDMSGRVEPIYTGLFEGAPEDAGYGLTLNRLRRDSGYNGEVMFTAKRPGQPDYAVRCLQPAPGEPATNGDCQRDIHAGRDLSVLYRFSSTLLPQWRAMDEAVRVFVDERLAAPQAGTFTKNR